MAQITIKGGDTLSKIAQQHGTTVADLVNANKGNTAVKSANLIIAGGFLNLPDKVGAPPAGPAAGAALPLGGLDAATVQDRGAAAVGDLGNLRIALRAALNEAAKNRVANNYQMVAPLAGGIPGTIGSVVDMIRGGVKEPVETTFSDIITGFREATSAKEKEQDRINELRAEYGSAVPSNVTDLKTALDLIAPLVDKERLAKLKKVGDGQVEDNDIETWAQFIADGGAIGSVPMKIRTRAKSRADVIMKENDVTKKQEYKDWVAFRIERKISDFNGERTLVTQDDNLTVAGQREMINYIDELEAASIANRSKGGGLSGLFGGGGLSPTFGPTARSTPSSLMPPAPAPGAPVAPAPLGPTENPWRL